MTLDVAMTTALSGLKVSQDALAVLSNNIANANTPGYSRRIVQQVSSSLNGIGQGALIEDITRNVDPFIIKEIRSQTSRVGYASTINDYNERIQLQLGQPGANNSLNTYLDNFFNALQSLSVNPELASIKQTAVDAGHQLALQISDFAETLQELRLEADGQLKSDVTFINQQLERIFSVNVAIQKAKTNGQNVLDLVERRERMLNELAAKINISVFEKDTGEIVISAANGVTLLDSALRELEYLPAPSLDVFVDNHTLTALTVNALNSNGERIGSPQILITEGINDDIVSNIATGEMRALTDLRDIEIPRMLEQLDQLAEQLRNAFNAIHNDGASLATRNNITGTRQVASTDQYTMSGSVRIGLVDSQGNPIPSAYDDEPGLRPLTLDLSTLNSGDSDGEITIQDIMDEINYYYGPPQPRVSLGNINDMKLVMVSDAIGAGNNVSFDLEMDNISATDATITIENVTITNNSAAAQAMVSTFPLSAYTVEAGAHKRAGSAGTITFTDDGAVDIPYTVSITVRVTNGSDAYLDTIEFEIGIPPLNVSDLRNARYPATAVSGTGDATLIPSPGGDRYALAELVDANGNAVNPGDPGFLRITTTNSSYGIAIDQMDSQELGLTDDPIDNGTGKGFSSFFELNDFFVRHDTVAGSALNLQVRSDILSRPGLIAIGTLSLSAQPSPGGPLYTYGIGSGDNQTITRLASLGSQLVSFGAAGDLAASNTTLVEYTADFVANLSGTALTAQLDLEQEQQFQTLFEERFSASSGVNLDEELANTILYQNAYTASARIISVAKELFDVLLKI